MEVNEAFLRNTSDIFSSLSKRKKEKVKFLSRNLKISKTKKNIPSPNPNKRSIYSLTLWVDFQAHFANLWCGVCAINLEFSVNQDQTLPQHQVIKAKPNIGKQTQNKSSFQE